MEWNFKKFLYYVSKDMNRVLFLEHFQYGLFPAANFSKIQCHPKIKKSSSFSILNNRQIF